MKHGFIKAAAATPDILVADCVHNSDEIIRLMDEMEKKEARVMVFPELSITGYTCGDLFYQSTLLESARLQLLRITEYTKNLDTVVIVGLPLEVNGKLYDTAAVLNRGHILGVIPKVNIPAHGEDGGSRYFTEAPGEVMQIRIGEEEVPFGAEILFTCRQMKDLKIAVEICEDLQVPYQPSISHVAAGASLIVNPAAECELVGRKEYRRNLVNGQSARLICGYVYAAAGNGESTTDMVFAGHNLICENGHILAQARRFENETIYSDIDVKDIMSERRRQSLFPAAGQNGYVEVMFDLDIKETKLDRKYPEHPFIPDDEKEVEDRCRDILMIQAMGLKKRLEHAHCTSAVLGISGGLDSTLALLVTAKTFDLLKVPREKIIAVTMPCFGTTDRTYQNACKLTKKLGATLKEVDIKEAVTIHFKDIGHDMNKHDVTYENSQARERTQVIMDIANQTGGMVIGTGDLSELALGWATYNGDHMSMYGVNGSVPKTLVRYIVKYCAQTEPDLAIAEILMDVLDTPVSPELLPPEEGKIAQKTEDLVGPYELHDFFIYYMLRHGFEPEKIYRLAVNTFRGVYEEDTIYKWLRNFYRRFFMQQFKRSCLPDGPKAGSVSVSPRGDLKMPSDACARIWMDQVEKLQKDIR